MEIEHKLNDILVYQSVCIEIFLKRFNIDNAHPLSITMVVRTLNPKKDQFCLKEDDEQILGLKV